MSTKIPTIVLYHKDMDGITAALVAKQKYPTAKLQGVQYGESLIQILSKDN